MHVPELYLNASMRCMITLATPARDSEVSRVQVQFIWCYRASRSHRVLQGKRMLFPDTVVLTSALGRRLGCTVVQCVVQLRGGEQLL